MTTERKPLIIVDNTINAVRDEAAIQARYLADVQARTDAVISDTVFHNTVPGATQVDGLCISDTVFKETLPALTPMTWGLTVRDNSTFFRNTIPGSTYTVPGLSIF